MKDSGSREDSLQDEPALRDGKPCSNVKPACSRQAAATDAVLKELGMSEAAKSTMTASPTGSAPTRTESDSMGKVEVPTDRYYGAQTARSLIHFAISKDTMPPE